MKLILLVNFNSEHRLLRSTTLMFLIKKYGMDDLNEMEMVMVSDQWNTTKILKWTLLNQGGSKRN